MQNGKGDRPRPLGVPRKQFDKNWEEAFGKREDKKKVKAEKPPKDKDD